jgi:hypothetical protein
MNAVNDDFHFDLFGYDIIIKYTVVKINYNNPKYISDDCLQKLLFYLYNEGFIPYHFAIMRWSKNLDTIHLEGRKIISNSRD